MDKILDSAKQSIPIAIDDGSFDADLLMCINTAVAILAQQGLQEAIDNPIVMATTTWTDLLGNRTDLEMVKTYIGFKTRVMFDPPTIAVVMDSVNRTIAEMEWRIANAPTIPTPITTVKEVMN